LTEAKEILGKLHGAPPVRFMRIRDKVNNRLTGLWVDTLKVGGNSKGDIDFKEIALEQTKVEETLTEKHILINLRQWHPDTSTLDPNEEIAVLKTTKISEFKAYLAKTYNLVEEFLRVVKPRPYQVKQLPKTGAAELDWFYAEDQGPEATLEKPWRVDHGNFLVFKDNRLAEKRIERKQEKMTGSSNAGPSLRILTTEEIKKRREDDEKRRKEREEEDAKLRIEAEERRKLGLGPTEEEKRKEEEEKRKAAQREAETEQARKEAIERAEAARAAGRVVNLSS